MSKRSLLVLLAYFFAVCKISAIQIEDGFGVSIQNNLKVGVKVVVPAAHPKLNEAYFQKLGETTQKSSMEIDPETKKHVSAYVKYNLPEGIKELSRFSIIETATDIQVGEIILSHSIDPARMVVTFKPVGNYSISPSRMKSGGGGMSIVIGKKR